jgi:hypothetical protein
VGLVWQQDKHSQAIHGIHGVAGHLVRPTRCNKLHQCSSSFETHQPKAYNLVAEATHFTYAHGQPFMNAMLFVIMLCAVKHGISSIENLNAEAKPSEVSKHMASKTVTTRGIQGSPSSGRCSSNR